MEKVFLLTCYIPTSVLQHGEGIPSYLLYTNQCPPAWRRYSFLPAIYQPVSSSIDKVFLLTCYVPTSVLQHGEGIPSYLLYTSQCPPAWRRYSFLPAIYQPVSSSMEKVFLLTCYIPTSVLQHGEGIPSYLLYTNQCPPAWRRYSFLPAIYQPVSSSIEKVRSVSWLLLVTLTVRISPLYNRSST